MLSSSVTLHLYIEVRSGRSLGPELPVLRLASLFQPVTASHIPRLQPGYPAHVTFRWVLGIQLWSSRPSACLTDQVAYLPQMKLNWKVQQKVSF